MMARLRFRWAAFGIVFILLSSGCASVPAQIAKTHQKELEIINSLQQSHLAMVDAYVDRKILNFKSFFFKTYGPAYLKHWRNNFKAVYNRVYEESRDFHVFYDDLVAQYQGEVAPIEDTRNELREAILRQYRHAIEAHQVVGGWMNTLKGPNLANIEAIDRLLGAINKELSLDSVEKAVNDAIAKTEAKIPKL